MVEADFVTIVASVLTSGGAVFLGAKWFAGRFVDDLLKRGLAEHQAKLDAALNASKAAIEAEGAQAQLRLQSTLHLANESLLGEAAAERAYRFDARKRLYSAVGPLRFQLIQAAEQFRARLDSIYKYGYSTAPDSYFGASVLFRIGRILALTELIERQIAYADFSVDPSMLQLLRFREQVLRALSSGDVPGKHPMVDWTQQKEHVVRDNIPTLSAYMTIIEADKSLRVARYDEFSALLKGYKKSGYMQPLVDQVARFDPTLTPIVWLRLIALAEACGGLIEKEALVRSRDPTQIDVRALLLKSQDADIRGNIEAYVAMAQGFRREAGSTAS